MESREESVDQQSAHGKFEPLVFLQWQKIKTSKEMLHSLIYEIGENFLM